MEGQAMMAASASPRRMLCNAEKKCGAHTARPDTYCSRSTLRASSDTADEEAALSWVESESGEGAGNGAGEAGVRATSAAEREGEEESSSSTAESEAESGEGWATAKSRSSTVRARDCTSSRTRARITTPPLPHDDHATTTPADSSGSAASTAVHRAPLKHTSSEGTGAREASMPARRKASQRAAACGRASGVRGTRTTRRLHWSSRSCRPATALWMRACSAVAIPSATASEHDAAESGGESGAGR
mmetsp:Transcript_15234/g.26117  ORF Transcript_15234/g.26117 Transcript_15234/m.26117 type:complete len:246 (+) Transcript_15234:82-819(+)